MNASYVEGNAVQRRRLVALTSGRTEAELRRDVGHGWTVAAKLVHLAFWDQYSLALIQRWERTGVTSLPNEVDALNEAVRVLSAALPPAAAIELAEAAAEAVDRKLEGISAELEAAVEAAGRPRVLRRSEHRREHLDQIEKALAR